MESCPPRTEEGKKRMAFVSKSFSRYDKVQDRLLSEALPLE